MYFVGSKCTLYLIGETPRETLNQILSIYLLAGSLLETSLFQTHTQIAVNQNWENSR